MDINLSEINSKELPKTESAMLQYKIDLENALSKLQADLKFNKQQSDFQDKNIEAMQTSLDEERKKITSLLETGDEAMPR